MTNSKQQENPQRQSKIVGICVINSAGKILLCQNTSAVSLQWDLPRVAYDQTTNTVITATNTYLQELGLNCELNEVFTAQPHQRSGATTVPPIEQIVVAFPMTASTETMLNEIHHVWVPIDVLLKNMQEKPSHYTTGLRTIIEGIELYLKNYLKNRATDTSTVSL